MKKSYTIYFNLLPLMKCSDRPTAAEAEIARRQALQDAQKQFKSFIKKTFTNQEVILAKTQPEDAIALSIQDQALDKVLQQLRELDLVAIIDADYCGK